MIEKSEEIEGGRRERERERKNSSSHSCFRLFFFLTGTVYQESSFPCLFVSTPHPLPLPPASLSVAISLSLPLSLPLSLFRSGCVSPALYVRACVRACLCACAHTRACVFSREGVLVINIFQFAVLDFAGNLSKCRTAV